MDDDLDKFYERLKRGPALLFFGQKHLAVESGLDSFLSEILRKYDTAGSNSLGYHQIFESEAGKSPSESVRWMHERCKRFAASESIKMISEFIWRLQSKRRGHWGRIRLSECKRLSRRLVET